MDGIRFTLGEGAAPFSAKLPGAEPDNRHPQCRGAQNSKTHERSLPQNRSSGT